MIWMRILKRINCSSDVKLYLSRVHLKRTASLDSRACSFDLGENRYYVHRSTIAFSFEDLKESVVEDIDGFKRIERTGSGKYEFFYWTLLCGKLGSSIWKLLVEIWLFESFEDFGIVLNSVLISLNLWHIYLVGLRRSPFMDLWTISISLYGCIPCALLPDDRE